MIHTAIIKCSADTLQQIKKHLLPKNQIDEEAAFAFGTANMSNQTVVVEINEWRLIKDSEYKIKSRYHIEFKDSIRGELIKRAHDINAALIEFHSHLGAYPAQFSMSDFIGFEDFVPHVMWRLPERPYVALVFSRGSFDGLIWATEDSSPKPIDKIVAGANEHLPTNLSLKRGIL